MEHFSYVLYVGFDAQRNLCDKQNVLLYDTLRTWKWFDIFRKGSWAVFEHRTRFRDNTGTKLDGKPWILPLIWPLFHGLNSCHFDFKDHPLSDKNNAVNLSLRENLYRWKYILTRWRYLRPFFFLGPPLSLPRTLHF